MSVLTFLSVAWGVVLVLALVFFLTSTAWTLRKARVQVCGIADDLERVAGQVAPLDPKVEVVAQEVAAIADALRRVDDSLGAVLSVVSELTPAGK